MSTGKIELSVGAVKIVDKNEMFTEEEISNIDKIPAIEDELEESVKFKVVGEGITVPPINGDGSYTLPIATETRLGGVKIGNNLSIDSKGVLSATTSDYDDTEIRELINETNTSLDNMENDIILNKNIFKYSDGFLFDTKQWDISTLVSNDEFIKVNQEYQLSTTNTNTKPRVVSFKTPLDLKTESIDFQITYKSNKECKVILLLEQNNSKYFFDRIVEIKLPISNEYITLKKSITLLRDDKKDTGCLVRIEHAVEGIGFLHFKKIRISPNYIGEFISYRDSNNVYMSDFIRSSTEDSQNNDSPRLKRAIEYAKSLNKKTTIILDETVYYVKEKIFIDNRINLKASSKSKIEYQTGFTDDYLVEVERYEEGIYGNVIIEGITFRGNAPHRSISGINCTVSTDLYDCRFEYCNTGIKFNAICLLKDSTIYENKIGVDLSFSESLIDNLHGASIVGIKLSGEGNRIINCKLHGDAMAVDMYSKYGIQLEGSRNVISNCYFDQWKICGIWIDSSKNSWLSSGAEKPTGAYANMICNNMFYNNGSGVYDNSITIDYGNKNMDKASAGIVMKTVDKGSASELRRNVITGNCFETGYFKGWDEKGTTTIATKVGIHLSGYASNTILDNIISSNSFDKEIETRILYHNASESDNIVGLNN